MMRYMSEETPHGWPRHEDRANRELGQRPRAEADITVWDPDGHGPRAAGLVLAGRFTVVGDVVATRIVFWDVDQRRRFIEEHALEVKNLDV
jgi:hypothetical protein